MTEERSNSDSAMRDDGKIEGSNRLGLTGFLCLLGLCALVLGPSAWHAGQLNFDDPLYYGPASPLATGGLARALDPGLPIANAWLPVTHLSIWLDLHLFGGPRGPHLHSLLLHVLGAFFLARLCGRLGLGRRLAFGVAAVFLLHPALVEGALWLSSRKVLLAGIFVFLSLDAVAAGARGDRAPGKSALLAGAFGLLAVYSNGTALVLPLCAAVVAWLAGGTDWRRARPAVLTLLVVAVAAGLHHLSIAAAEGTIRGGGSVAERLARVPGAFLHYVTTALWPVSLDVLYPEVKTFESFASRLLPGLCVIAAWIAAIVLLRKRAPRVAAGLAWFALALLPFNTAFPATALAAADRYLYLAIPGLALALGSLRRPIGGIACAVAIVPLAILAHGRAAAFESSDALWRASLARDSDNAAASIDLAADIASRNPLDDEVRTLLTHAAEVARYPEHRFQAEKRLASRAQLDGRLEEAYRHAQRAARALDALGDGADVRRQRVGIHLTALRIARRRGDDAAVAEQLGILQRIDPDAPEVLCDRAEQQLAGALDASAHAAPDAPGVVAARALLERVLSTNPNDYEAQCLLGRCDAATGALLSAEKHFRDAIAIDPTRPEAHRARIEMLLGEEGMAATAESAARQALAAGVDDPQIQYFLAVAQMAQNHMEDARRRYEAYLALKPNDRDARLGLARVIAAIGHQKLYTLTPDELDRLADRVLELEPDNADGRLMRAVAARGRREMLKALVLLERLHEESPDDREILELYAQTLRDRGWELKLAGGRDDAAFDEFVKFLAVAPDQVPTDAVRNAVIQEWHRKLEAGQQALIHHDLDAAETALRRCLALRPDEVTPNLQLGMTFLERGPDHAAEALKCFEAVAKGQRARDADASLAVLYEIRALQLLGRDDEARQRGETFLKDPGPAQADVLERIRVAIAL